MRASGLGRGSRQLRSLCENLEATLLSCRCIAIQYLNMLLNVLQQCLVWLLQPPHINKASVALYWKKQPTSRVLASRLSST